MEGKQGVTTLSSTLTNHVSRGCNVGPNNNGCGIRKRSGLRGAGSGLNSLNNGTREWGRKPHSTVKAPTGSGAPTSQASAGNLKNVGGTPGPVGSDGSTPSGSASNSSLTPPNGALENPEQALPSADNNPPSGAHELASTSPNCNNTSQKTNGQLISGKLGFQINPNGNVITQDQPSHNNTNRCGNVSKNHDNLNQRNSVLGVNANLPGSAHTGSALPAGTASCSRSMTCKSIIIKQLNNKRGALLRHNGWGGQNVNQDSSWAIPSSPEPPHPRMSRTSNTSREYIPASNFGGTWGDYDGDGTPDLPNACTEAIATANIPAVNNNSGGQSGQVQRGMNNGPQQAPYNTGVEKWTFISKQSGPHDCDRSNNNGRVDGGGNMSACHVGVRRGDNHREGFVGNENSPTKCAWDDRNSNQLNNGHVDANPGMWNNPQQPPQQSEWVGYPGPGSINGNPTGECGWNDVSPPILLLVPLYSPSSSTLTSQQQLQHAPMGMVGHGQMRGGGYQGPDTSPNVFKSAGESGGWNYDHSLGSWEEPQLPQNDSNWNKPKTPTSPNSSWVDDDGLVVAPNMGATEEELEQLNFRSSNVNLSDVMVQVSDQLSGSPVVGVGRRLMDRPWGNALDNGQIGPQGRGPTGLADDHFELALGPGGPMGMGPPPPQPIGGFLPNPIEFSDANNIMSNNHQQFNLQGRVRTNNAMSPAQLQLLAQEIRMGLEAGYLNSPFFSRPLPQQSLHLLNQLLQQIKFFLYVTERQRQIGTNYPSAAAQLNEYLAESRQIMAMLHNQMAAQAKQQQQHQHHPLRGTNSGGPGNPSNNDFNKPPPGFGDNHDVGSSGSSIIVDLPMALCNNFGLEGIPHQTSKLGQWTTQLSSLEKEDNAPASEAFSGAPTQQANNSSSNILKYSSNFTLRSTDNIWSSVAQRSGGDGWPSEDSSSTCFQSVDNSSFMQPHDSSKASSSVSTNADTWPAGLVPEFEPGKPWIGINLGDDDQV